MKGSERKQIKLSDEFDENQFGDKFIREARITREHELKLNQIDAQLERIKALRNQSSESSVNQFSDQSYHSTDQVRDLILNSFNHFVLKKIDAFFFFSIIAEINFSRFSYRTWPA